jgi:hypothetical protein
MLPRALLHVTLSFYIMFLIPFNFQSTYPTNTANKRHEMPRLRQETSSEEEESNEEEDESWDEEESNEEEEESSEEEESNEEEDADEEMEGKWNITRIAGVKKLSGSVYYKISWEGYSHEHDTWELKRKMEKDVGKDDVRILLEKYEEDGREESSAGGSSGVGEGGSAGGSSGVVKRQSSGGIFCTVKRGYGGC